MNKNLIKQQLNVILGELFLAIFANQTYDQCLYVFSGESILFAFLIELLKQKKKNKLKI
jgi:hypothetical protein